MSMYNITTLWVPFKSENCMTVLATQNNPVGTDYFIYLCMKSCSLVVCFLLPKAPFCKGPQYVSFCFNEAPPTPTLLAQPSPWPSTTYTNTHFVPHGYSWTAWPWSRKQCSPSKCLLRQGYIVAWLLPYTAFVTYWSLIVLPFDTFALNYWQNS